MQPIFSFQQLTGRTPPNEIVPAAHGRRLFLNLIDKEFAFGLLRTVVPWYKIPWIVVLMVSFLLCRTRLFLREFARIVMNPIGIIGQYQSIVKFCGQSVHASKVHSLIVYRAYQWTNYYTIDTFLELKITWEPLSLYLTEP